MPSRRISRRSMMKTLGGIGAAALFRGLIRDALAGDAASQPRFVLLGNAHGCAPELWRPRAAGGGPATETDFVLDFNPDSSLGPLEAHKDSLVIIEGLDLTTNYDGLNPILTGHPGGLVAPSTGRHTRTPNDLNSDGPSIHFFAAKKMGVEPFLFSPGGYSGNSLGNTYDDAGVRIPFEFDLRFSYEKWFASFMPPSSMGDPKAAAKAKAELAVLSYLNGEAKRLRPRLAGPERMKVEAHLDALSVLEKKISAPNGLPSMACTKPDKPVFFDYTQAAWETYNETILLFAAQLLACNLTRVVNVEMVAGATMPWLGFGTLDVHDDIAHGYRADQPDTVRRLSKMQRWYAQNVAHFIELMKAIPENNGTAYDNTILYWVNELGDPAAHMNNNVPFVLAGGGGSYKKGRYLKYGTGPAYSDPQDPNGRLLTSLANQYGANLEVFGDPKYPGELPGL